MNFLRKFKTAGMVLKEYGFKEVCGLVKDNVKAIFSAIGRKLSRLFSRLDRKIALNMPRNSAKPRILFITTQFEATMSQTVRYRVHNVRAALKGKAQTRFELIEDGISKDEELLDWADIIVLMRTTYMESVGELVENAKKLNIPVVFDIDDIIFLPEFAYHYCRVLGDTSEENVSGRSKEFEGFEKTFKLCDYATASTHFIVDQMLTQGKKAYVIHNGLNKQQIAIAKKSSRKEDGHRAIGYLSGTKTHDKDFLQAFAAIVRIMKEYPDVVLRVAGYLDTSILPKELQSRIIPACYMSWKRLMAYGAQNYINIAPLDVSNPFCNAKSELKYFEAAVVGVPTVASSTDTFLRAIRNGENGMLAANEEEWYSAIKKLLDDKDFYTKVSKNAKAAAYSDYAPKRTAEEALFAYKNIIADYKERQKK